MLRKFNGVIPGAHPYNNRMDCPSVLFHRGVVARNGEKRHSTTTTTTTKIYNNIIINKETYVPSSFSADRANCKILILIIYLLHFNNNNNNNNNNYDVHYIEWTGQQWGCKSNPQHGRACF